MSLHIVVVAIKGNHISKLPSFFERAGYTVLGPPTIAGTFAEVDGLSCSPNRDPSQVLMAAHVKGDWTIIEDWEMKLFEDRDLLIEISQEWQVPILALICHGVSTVYGMRYCRQGLFREIICVEGEVSEECGSPLPEESGMDWLDEDEAFELAGRLGVPYPGVGGGKDYYVFILDKSSGKAQTPPAAAVASPPLTPDRSVGTKPRKWWQFWR